MSLADLLKPSPVIQAPPGRIVRPMGADPLDATPTSTTPSSRPFLAGDAKGDLLQPARGDETMPKGIYNRKNRKKAAAEQAPRPASPAAADAPPSKRRGPRKPRQARANGAAKAQPFGVSVHVDFPSCKGTLTGDEAKQLVAFISSLKT